MYCFSPLGLLVALGRAFLLDLRRLVAFLKPAPRANRPRVIKPIVTRSLLAPTLVVGLLVLGESCTCRLPALFGLDSVNCESLSSYPKAFSTATATPTPISSSSDDCSTPSPTDTTLPSAPPALVQHAVRFTKSRTNAVKFPQQVGEFDLIVVAITTFHETVTAVKDSTTGKDQPPNAYHRVVQPLIAMPRYSNDRVELWYASNVLGGSLTVTVSFSDPGYYASDNNVGIYEYSELHNGVPIEQATSNVGEGNMPDGGTLAKAALYFAVGVDDGPDKKDTSTLVTPGSGYRLLDHQDTRDDERFYTEDLIAPHGAYHTNFSLPYSSNWGVIGVAFQS